MRSTILLLSALLAFNLYAQETVTISGRVTDFDGQPIDSCTVEVLYPDFSAAYTALSDKEGYYSIPGVAKGKYMGIYAMRLEEYPRQLQVREEDMRLEFWAWNVLAYHDLMMDIRYHRLELYGTTVFKENGGYPGMIIYTRPMSLGRALSYGEEIYKDKAKSEEVQDVSAEPGDIEFKVYAGNAPLTVRSVQPVEEYVGGGRQMAYVIYTDLPEKRDEKFCVYRVVAYNRAWGGEAGENIYFYEMPGYEEKK